MYFGGLHRLHPFIPPLSGHSLPCWGQTGSLFSLLLPPLPSSFLSILDSPPRGWEKPITSLSCVSATHTHTQICSPVSPGWLESCCVVTPDPCCAQTDSVFTHKHHSGPFKNRSTQHPLLHAGVTWCHNQTPCCVRSPGLIFCLLFFIPETFPPTMDLSCPLLHFGFTSEPRFLANSPWPETLNSSKQ